MNNSQLIGVIKGQTAANTIYRTIGANVYNQNNNLSSLSDVQITTPLNGQILAYRTTTPNFINRFNTFQTGTANVNWSDMIGFPINGSNLFSQTLTYNNATQKYVQFQRLHSSINGTGMTLDSAKLITGGIYSITVSNFPTTFYAYSGGSVANSNSVVSSTIMATYLTAASTGITLTNGCYNRAFEVNGFLNIPLTTFTDNSSFIVYVYLGETIINQTSVVCRTGDTQKIINIYAVVNTTVANVGQKIDFRLQYTGSTLTTGASMFNFSVKSL
jgi:hypothetical protein